MRTFEAVRIRALKVCKELGHSMGTMYRANHLTKHEVGISVCQDCGRRVFVTETNFCGTAAQLGKCSKQRVSRLVAEELLDLMNYWGKYPEVVSGKIKLREIEAILVKGGITRAGVDHKESRLIS